MGRAGRRSGASPGRPSRRRSRGQGCFGSASAAHPGVRNVSMNVCAAAGSRRGCGPCPGPAPCAGALGQGQQQKGLAHPGQPFSAPESCCRRCCFRSQPAQILSPAPEGPSFAQGTAACPAHSTRAVGLPGCPAWENCSGVANIGESMEQGRAVVTTPIAMSPEVPGEGERSLQGLAGPSIAHRFDREFGSQTVQPAAVPFPGRQPGTAGSLPDSRG